MIKESVVKRLTSAAGRRVLLLGVMLSAVFAFN